MKRQIRYGALFLMVGAGGGAYADQAVAMSDSLGLNDLTHEQVAQGYGSAMTGSSAAASKPDSGIQAGPLKITFGGFTELAAIYRSRNETADVGSSFNAIPFANASNYYVPEYRESGRQSRLAMLVQGPTDGLNKAEAYFETDFLSAGVTSNSNESNSYSLRIRQAYGLWKHDDMYILGGQAWSLATMYKKGLVPRQEDVPLTIDAQYVVGTNWARQAGLRVVKNFGDMFAVGLALEEPQDVVKGTTPSGADANNTGGSLLGGSGATQTFSTDIAPDVVLKLAADPGFGHYELYSLTRFFHDRAESTPGTLITETNNTTTAESIGAGAILPAVPKMLDVEGTTLIGRGNGRYGSAQLADSTFNPGDGSISAVLEEQARVGVIAHPTSVVDLYAYTGFEHQKGEYSLIPANNASCDVNIIDASILAKTATCGGIGTARQIAGGVWWKPYKGSLGYIMTGAQVSYTKLTTYESAEGTVGKTNDTMAFFSFRYYPYQ